MPGPALDAIFDYVAVLIAEREPDEPFLLRQIQPAIQYKFPDFSFASYDLNGLKDFLLAGENSGYFKLVNTGDLQTAYLSPGPRSRPVAPQPTPAGTEILSGDPRRTQWMTLAVENMLSADRADQILDAVRGLDILTPAFDQFMVGQEKNMTLYPVRGKLRRLREFLAVMREHGEAQAIASWQPSRTMLRMISVPPMGEAARRAALIWSLMQGNLAWSRVSVAELDNLFFAVLAFARERATRSRSMDWVAGLDILEEEARAVPRPPAPAQKRTLFGGKTGKLPPTNDIDDFEIEVLINELRKAAGVKSRTDDETATWQTYVDTPDLAASYRFLSERPDLLKDDRLLNYLEGQISKNVAAGAFSAVKNLANKAALFIGARQSGLQEIRQKPDDLRHIFDQVMESAQVLGAVLGFLDTTTTTQGVDYLKQNSRLLDEESIGAMLDDQFIQAAREGDVNRYRKVSDRVNLWRSVVELGSVDGAKQHERFLAAPRDDRKLMAEMGLLLLPMATSVDERRDILERYPSVATKEGLQMANGTLEMLSFHEADRDEYNRYFEIKRLIERCVEIGIDRALSELK